MRKPWIAVALLSLLGAPALHADEHDGHDYRVELVIADVASWGVFALAAHSNSDALGYAGIGGLYFAAPIIHGINGNHAGIWESFALRAGLTAAGAFIGYQLSPPRDGGLEGSRELGALGLGMAGLVTAQLADWIFIGGKSRVGEKAAPASNFTITPAFAAGPMGGQIAAVGTF